MFLTDYAGEISILVTSFGFLIAAVKKGIFLDPMKLLGEFEVIIPADTTGSVPFSKVRTNRENDRRLSRFYNRFYLTKRLFIGACLLAGVLFLFLLFQLFNLKPTQSTQFKNPAPASKVVKVSEIQTGKMLHEFKLEKTVVLNSNGGYQPVNDLMFVSPDGNVKLVSINAGQRDIYQISSAGELRKIPVLSFPGVIGLFGMLMAIACVVWGEILSAQISKEKREEAKG